jgi:ABC-type lipoprotein release transport system permease subunit
MRLWSLVQRSLGFYWRTNLGVLLAVTVSTAVLTGALLVGDSVRHTLRLEALARLGTTQVALAPQNRFFRVRLADELQSHLNAKVTPILHVRGLVVNGDGTKRVNRVEVLGVDERFFELGGGGNPFGHDLSEAVIINVPLARRLDVRARDEIVLRIEKPGLMPREAPLALDSDLSMAFRLVVGAVAERSQFGRFSLQANQLAPFNVFVPLQWLQQKLGQKGQANMLLVGGSVTAEKANEAIRRCWRLADASLELRELQAQNLFEIRSKRIFIDESLGQAAMDAGDESVGIFTYFVNEFRLGDRTSPYAIVTAMGEAADANWIIPTDMRDDEILINRWLAEDLRAQEGDNIELTYFVVGPMRKLSEEKASFRVRKILAMEGAALDRELMPDYPGLVDVNNCRDWKPGIPVDLTKIGDREEEYWRLYRGTPKAFITLKAGQALWSNMYGNLTAVRYPRTDGAKSKLTERILGAVEPASVGLFFQSVRERGLRAGDEATDFRYLFLGLSMFLVMAALILIGLLFVFGVESRSEQVGMFLAVGFSPRLVRRLLFAEGGALAGLGAIVGVAAGLLYTKAMIYGLSTVWRGAIAGSAVHFHAGKSTLFVGAIAGTAVALTAIWLTLRKQASRPARELLAGGMESQYPIAGRIAGKKPGLWLAAIAAAGAVVLLALVGTGGSSAVSGAFFGAGGLLLIAGLGLTHALLRAAASGWRRPMSSLTGFGLRNSIRRSGRSLAVVGLLACGIFLVTAVGANRHDPTAGADKRDSGTGGFALYGESAIGILHDMDSPSWRRSMSLDDGSLEGVTTVQLRVHDGDDASCLNLNRAQQPRLLGVQPEQLKTRGAFGFVDTIGGTGQESPWDLLKADYGEGVVPAIGDYPTIIWALGKSIGDEIEYRDEMGRTFRLRVVAMFRSSILQGSLLICDEAFVKRFPSEAGFRLFLIDAPEDKIETTMGKLSLRLRDFGLELTRSKERLIAFSEVEHTYLSIFQMLGGLGLILGSVGLGLVVLRNMLERRGEFAMLRAVGFKKAALKRMVSYEHVALCVGGLVCGVAAALIAVAPALRSAGPKVPYLSLTLMVVAIAISGLVWIWIASACALSGKMLEALRNE